MIAFLILLGLLSLAISIAFVVGTAKWIGRQFDDCDCAPDWDDCL